MVVHGLPNTVGVTLEMMILHGQAVMRGSQQAMVVVDMPFGSYEGSPRSRLRQRRADHEGDRRPGGEGRGRPDCAGNIEYLVKRGIPVMGHVGLRPQAVLVDGGFKAKGKGRDERRRDPRRGPRHRRRRRLLPWSSRASPRAWPAKSPRRIDVPTIGIGASAGCDGQILVTDDMLGLFDWTPKFVRRYADLRGEISRGGRAPTPRTSARAAFPGPAETYFAKAG